MDALEAGFADPVADAQTAFRALLDAMARPGRLATFVAPAKAPTGFGIAAAAVALALADIDTPVWLSPACAPAADWVRFHCGTKIVANVAASRFAFATAADCPTLAELDAGSNEYPNRSSTLVLEVPHLAAPGPLVLRGPGIESTHTAEIAGLPPEFWSKRAMLHEIFPRGIDIVFVAGAAAIALPRTTRVEV
jgi:alpha-D-ribose 1-methylphosphonate 5-triphosphate synthase subunit PhnH